MVDSLSPLTLILISCAAISLLALVGFITILLAQEVLEEITTGLVSFAAGALIGGAFFTLLPESVEEGGPTFAMAVVGIASFFAIEVFLYSYFAHVGHMDPRLCVDDRDAMGHQIKPVGPLSLVGDSIHSIVDGVIIASSFLVSVELGILTSIIVALHELPQELGDFAILLYSGYDKMRALALNFLAALAIFAGALGFYAFSERIIGLVTYAVPFAAGAFIYIAAADLLPEIKEAPSMRQKVFHFLLLIAGIILLWLLRTYVGLA